ncbi:aminopeptidase N [Rothia sp. P6271]|uniref:aminopeptidase N n=1 Tax=Rothia sp. P6271 TaxID=3402659 RepID=UPI003AD60413
MNENLTQEEASARAELLTVDSYDVLIDLTYAKDTTFDSYPVVTTVRFTATENAETFIDYIHHTVESVKLNGKTLNINDCVVGSRIVLTELRAENILTIHGRSFFSRSGEGLHRYLDPKDGKIYLYTQYEPADCRRVFPNFEQPDLKAIFNFRITAPKDWVVSSNAPLIEEIPDPTNENITKRVFAPTERISTYITTILAGEYFAAYEHYSPRTKVSDSSFELVAYCRQSLKEYFDYDNIFTITKAGLDFFQTLFDTPYPYPQYQQAFVPEYNLGAMENPGLVTFTESYIFESGATEAQYEARANVICHEMSHMWFGDLVTMKWWNDLWLKESFAEYMGTLGAHEAAGFNNAWVSFANQRKAWAYTQDQLPTTHPIVADIQNLEAAKQNFDGITYAKGSSALKQLVAYVGFDTFIAASRLYFQRYAGLNTTLNDFLEVLDECSTEDVYTWAQAWLQTSGLSTLIVERHYTQQQEFKSLTISQLLPEDVPTELGRPHHLLLETFQLQENQLISTSLIECSIPAGPVEDMELPLNEEERTHVAQAELLVLNSGDLTYAKTVISKENGQELALSHVHTIENPLTRGIIWSSLWNQVRDGFLEVEKFLTAVEKTLGSEPVSVILSNLLAQTNLAISSYAQPALRKQLWDQFTDSLKTALYQAPEGSDEQLIITRAFLEASAHSLNGESLVRHIARYASSEESITSTEIPGLELNSTLGWNALIALSVHGLTTVEELQQQQQQLPGSISERSYAQAQASLPHQDSKMAAFERVLTQTDVSNDILTATARGFQQGGYRLCPSLIQQYFDALNGVWENRSIGMATRTVSGLFPPANLQADQAVEQNPVIVGAQQWLEHNGQAPGALRRLILEHLDQSKRALKAQQFNAESV